MLTQHQLPDHLIASPGQMLDEWLAERSMTQADFAARMDVSAKYANQLIKGKATLSAPMAMRLETVTGVQAETWLRIEAEYQAKRERIESAANLDGADSLLESAFIKNLRDAGFVTATRREPGRLKHELLTFFQVGTMDALDRLCAARQASYQTAVAFESDSYALEAWMILAELEAREVATERLDPRALKELVPRLRAISRGDPGDVRNRLREALAGVGVALVFVPEVAGARCSGVTLRPTAGRAIVALSSRAKSDDAFWFTLFHALGHVVHRHPGKAFLHHAGKADNAQTDLERQADEFARHVLQLDDQ